MPSFLLLVTEGNPLYMTGYIFKLKWSHRVLELEQSLEIA